MRRWFIALLRSNFRCGRMLNSRTAAMAGGLRRAPCLPCPSQVNLHQAICSPGANLAPAFFISNI